VQVEVWRRDPGQCVECGSTKNLHFDHDIPFSKGGSSLTAANVRLLCAKCNLQKSDKILTIAPWILAGASAMPPFRNFLGDILLLKLSILETTASWKGLNVVTAGPRTRERTRSRNIRVEKLVNRPAPNEFFA
jgi:HNH endonuclease